MEPSMAKREPLPWGGSPRALPRTLQDQESHRVPRAEGRMQGESVGPRVDDELGR